MDVRPEQQARIGEICRRYHVKRLSLFGSSATGTEGPDSDVDVLVEFRSGEAPSAFRLVDLQEELSSVFDGRPVDLAFPAILRNPFRRRAIGPQLRTIYAEAVRARPRVACGGASHVPGDAASP